MHVIIHLNALWSLDNLWDCRLLQLDLTYQEETAPFDRLLDVSFDRATTEFNKQDPFVDLERLLQIQVEWQVVHGGESQIFV